MREMGIIEQIEYLIQMSDIYRFEWRLDRQTFIKYRRKDSAGNRVVIFFTKEVRNKTICISVDRCYDCLYLNSFI